jgi:hypothetical protein
MASGKVSGMRDDEQYGRTATGRRITDDLINELAAKAEDGYDTDELLRRRLQPTPTGESSDDL